MPSPPVVLARVLEAAPPEETPLTGASGVVLAMPPIPGRRPGWTFVVDGCTCEARSHRSLTSAEYCSMLVVGRRRDREVIAEAATLLGAVDERGRLRPGRRMPPAPVLRGREAKAP